MAIELEIRDGDPWYMSPDIWVVPGTDPEGPPGTPIVGVPAFLWARVRNRGSTLAQNAIVRFYWADPSVGFDRNTANPIGTSFVTLGPGQVGETLCLQPWIPEFVNDGHECVLAEAFHDPGDPLPPSPVFNVPTDRHVAQRNLSVVLASATGFFRLTFGIFNTQRVPRDFHIALEIGTDEQLKPLLATIDLPGGPPQLGGQLERAVLVEERCPDEKILERDSPLLSKGERLQVKPHGRANRTLAGRLRGGPALIRIVQRTEKAEVGGIGLLVLPHREEG